MINENGDQMIVKDHDYLVTETIIDLGTSADVLLAHLRQRGTTGRILIEVNQGGVRQIMVTERTRATEKQRDTIRQALGMD